MRRIGQEGARHALEGMRAGVQFVRGKFAQHVHSADVGRLLAAWSAGVGISVAAGTNTTVDLGYRYTDLGTTESGWNRFANARGLQDEKMQLDLASREVTLGVRYAF